jgi:hypothetical protein
MKEVKEHTCSESWRRETISCLKVWFCNEDRKCSWGFDLELFVKENSRAL